MSNVYDQVRNQEKRIGRYQDLAEEIGIDDSLVEPRESFFSSFLNYIDKPKQAVLGVLDSAFGRGDIFEDDVGFGIERAFEERANMFDVLRREGVTNPYVRGIAGFTGEVLLDPLTYLTFGSNSVGRNVAKAGGREVTEKGGQALAKLTASAGDDFIRASDFADDIFENLGRYSEGIKAFDKTKNIYKKADLRSKIFSAYEGFKDFIPELEQVGVFAKGSENLDDFMSLGKPLEEVFADKNIHVNLSLPFLGHLTGRQGGIEGLSESASAFTKVFDNLGKVINPDTVGVSFKAELPVFAGEMLDQIKASTAKALTGIDNAPILGTVKRLGEKAGELSGRVIDGAKSVFDDIFRPGKSLRSKDAALARERYLINGREAAAIDAGHKTWNVMADYIDKPIVRQDAGIILDTAAGRVIDDLLVDPEKKGAILRAIGEATAGGRELSEEVVRDILVSVKKGIGDGTGIAVDRGIDDLFVNKLALLIKERNPSEETVELINRLKSTFDQVHAEEQLEGVSTSFIDYYLPHIVTTLSDRRGASIKAGGAAFTEERKYDTLLELFEHGGHLAKADSGTILYNRLYGSKKLIAEKKFTEKAMMLSNSPEGLIQNAFRQAVTGDADAYEFLKQGGWTVPRDLADEQIDSIAAFVRNDLKGTEIESLFKKEGGAAVRIRAFDALQGIGNEAVARYAAMGGRNVDIPLSVFGNPGTYEKIGGKQFYIPPTVANAIDEVKSAVGPIEKALKGHPTAKAIVGWADHAISTLKTMVTKPWPGYWSQNVIGDGVRRMMDQSIGVLNPGSYAEVNGLLKGSNSLRTKFGTVIPPQEFQKIVNLAGVKMSADAHLGIIQNLENLDLVKLEKAARGVKDNLKRGEILTVMNKAGERMQDTFENFMRIQQLAHELKKGSTAQGAIKAMNDIMFNYRDLSNIEKSVFQRFYLFYPWTKKATAHSINNIFTKPGSISNGIRSARGFAEFFSSPDAIPTFEQHDANLLKDVVQSEQIAFPLGEDPEGLPITARFSALPVNTLLQQFTIQVPRNLDFSEILDAGQASTMRTLQKQFASANPIFRMIGEQISGKNLYFDKPLSASFLRTVPKMSAIAEKIGAYPYTHIPADLLDSATAKFLGGVDNGRGGMIVDPTKFYILSNFVPGLSRAISTANRFADERIPLPPALLHFLTGIRVDPTDVYKARLSDVERSLRDTLESTGAFQEIRNRRE